LKKRGGGLVAKKAEGEPVKANGREKLVVGNDARDDS